MPTNRIVVGSRWVQTRGARKGLPVEISDVSGTRVEYVPARSPGVSNQGKWGRSNPPSMWMPAHQFLKQFSLERGSNLPHPKGLSVADAVKWNELDDESYARVMRGEALINDVGGDGEAMRRFERRAKRREEARASQQQQQSGSSHAQTEPQEPEFVSEREVETNGVVHDAAPNEPVANDANNEQQALELQQVLREMDEALDQHEYVTYGQLRQRATALGYRHMSEAPAAAQPTQPAPPKKRKFTDESLARLTEGRRQWAQERFNELGPATRQEIRAIRRTNAATMAETMKTYRINGAVIGMIMSEPDLTGAAPSIPAKRRPGRPRATPGAESTQQPTPIGRVYRLVVQVRRTITQEISAANFEEAIALAQSIEGCDEVMAVSRINDPPRGRIRRRAIA